MKAEIKAELQTYLEGLLKILGDSAEIQFKHETDREVFINLQGFSSLDGSDPKPLRSLSYLTEICIRRKSGKGIKVYLDANGSQERRLDDLRQLAKRSAEQVLLQNSRVELDPMETQERKLIHEALSEVPGVKTHSEGQGIQRRIVIQPMSGSDQQEKSKKSRSKKRPDRKDSTSTE